MRKWVKVTLSLAAVAALLFTVLAGAGAYYVFRHLDTRSATEADTKDDFDGIRTKFKDRAPLVEIRNLASGDLVINRAVHPQGKRATTVHVMTWSAEESQFLRTDVPVWLTRFSSINILSHLGIAPQKFRLTAEDLERYGPGIVVDYKQPGRNQVLIWLE